AGLSRSGKEFCTPRSASAAGRRRRERLGDALPRDQFEVLRFDRVDVAPVLHHEHSAREGRSERSARDVQAVRFGGAVYACREVRGDMEHAEELVLSLAAIQGVVVGALTGYDDVARAVRTVVDG